MAGFQLTLHGRIWVIPEETSQAAFTLWFSQSSFVDREGIVTEAEAVAVLPAASVAE
jgi:hypothetical protein